jgi:hypothetical protein
MARVDNGLDASRERATQLQIAEQLALAAVVVADDAVLFGKAMAPYLQFVRNPANCFQSVTLPLGPGLEYSVRL